MTVTNPGSSATGSGSFSDPLPDPPLDAAGASWTCTPSAGSTCGSRRRLGITRRRPPDVPITVAPNGGTVTFTITATIRPSGVTVDDPQCRVGHPRPRHRMRGRAADLRRRGHTFTANPTPAPLTITKTHSPPSPLQGDAVTYTITVSNTSPTTQAEGTVDDPFDSPALQGITWTAVASHRIHRQREGD